MICIVISKSDGLSVQEKGEEMSPRLDSGNPVALPGFMKDTILFFEIHSYCLRVKNILNKPIDRSTVRYVSHYYVYF